MKEMQRPKKSKPIKIIVINKDEGQYAVPLEVVAKNRTLHYAARDDFAPDSAEWTVEAGLVMRDKFTGVDWLVNNMDWADVKFCALRLNADEVMQEDFWSCTDDFKIQEVDGREMPFYIWGIETRKNYPEKFL